MTKYSLLSEQKELLNLIARGIQDKLIERKWIYINDRGRIGSIFGVNNTDLHNKIVEMLTEADIDDFAEAGFFRFDGERAFTLNAQKIIDAVNSNFGEDEQPNPNSITSSITFAPIWDTPIAISQFKADIFVMMPFKPEMKHIYDDCMKPAAQSLNMSINRGDDFFTKHPIVKDIWSAIYHCRIVIADCTGKNANVFYELGMTHTVGKPVILIAQNKDDIPFDVQGHRYIIYSDTPEGLANLTNELISKVPKALET